MRDRLEAIQRWGADALRGRARHIDELRPLRFQLGQFFQKPVVFGVGDFRAVELIIKPVVAFDFATEFPDPGKGALFLHHLTSFKWGLVLICFFSASA